MDEFRIAGSTVGESEEQQLSQVVQIAGYTSGIRALVRDSFRFCHVHGVSIPKTRRKSVHDGCVNVRRVAPPVPRSGLR